MERSRFFNLTRMFQKDWIPGQVTPPNRYALWRGPRQPGMTRYIAWLALFQGWRGFGVQAGKIACFDFLNPKVGLDFKRP